MGTTKWRKANNQYFIQGCRLKKEIRWWFRRGLKKSIKIRIKIGSRSFRLRKWILAIVKWHSPFRFILIITIIITFWYEIWLIKLKHIGSFYESKHSTKLKLKYWFILIAINKSKLKYSPVFLIIKLWIFITINSTTIK